MTVPVGVGIVGLGFGEHVLLPAFRAHAACEVVGVVGMVVGDVEVGRVVDVLPEARLMAAPSFA